MINAAEWARDLLLSRGALVESEENEVLRALLPPEVATTLEAGEWLSLNFGGSAGADDAVDWIERLARLLPAGQLVTGARTSRSTPAPSIDAESVLARELVIQNGIYRFVEDHSATAQYFLFTFQYTVESDERNTGVLKVCLNATADCQPPQANLFWAGIETELEDDPEFVLPAGPLARMYPMAASVAQTEVRQLIAGIEETANRRFARDSERVESYYRGLLRQIDKRIARKSGDTQTIEKERSRAEATRLDRRAKLDDLVRKYTLRVEVQLTDVLVLRLPVREIAVRLIRKKEERVRTLHWNTVLRRLEQPLCEKCSRRAHPLFLCEKVHCLCRECWAACPNCGRNYCHACQTDCKCGKT